MKLRRSATVQGRVQHSAAKAMLRVLFVYFIIIIHSLFKTQRGWIVVIRFYLLIRRISLDTKYALHFG